ncbi:nuclear transport factor 2 family protein [Microbulbifer variabilis]|uniref:nuclear transport factor 2 family protein n=1 Tax=Microbulbifer variabilis TaxID=266805 RepID=UPI001CFD4FBB|nr:nuclear transport factor 2 family protein [Microbulbifer variabilis]
MYKTIPFILLAFLTSSVYANSAEDNTKIRRSVLDYIEAQQKVEPDLMERGLDEKLAKRTYWKSKNGSEFIMETDYETMIWLAENYNKEGDKFPVSPRIDIDILDIDNRVASVKLTVDDWIDYMHLYKNEKNDWKIINVLWQYHDTEKHVNIK